MAAFRSGPMRGCPTPARLSKPRISQVGNRGMAGIRRRWRPLRCGRTPGASRNAPSASCSSMSWRSCFRSRMSARPRFSAAAARPPARRNSSASVQALISAYLGLFSSGRQPPRLPGPCRRPSPSSLGSGLPSQAWGVFFRIPELLDKRQQERAARVARFSPAGLL